MVQFSLFSLKFLGGSTFALFLVLFLLLRFFVLAAARAGVGLSLCLWKGVAIVIGVLRGEVLIGISLTQIDTKVAESFFTLLLV